MSKNIKFVFALLVLTILLSISVLAVEPKLWTTDINGNPRYDYAPTEIVYINGEGFLLDADVLMSVTWPDGTGYSGVAHTDLAGYFVYEHDLAGNGILGEYLATATDGVNYAEVIFTDAPPAVSLEQCRNGASGSPVNCTELSGPLGWTTGSAGTSNAHYVEGLSVPYRLVMTDLPTGTLINLTLEYDVKHSGKHAIDYLTHYDRIPEEVYPTNGVSGINPLTTTYAIPAPSSIGSPVPGQPTTSFNSLPAGERVMTLFGGTISNIYYVSHGNLTEAQSATQINVIFTVLNETAVLAWGGHIGSALDWGANQSAGGISGAPYHMRTIDWNLNNLGNQDRSLSTDAIEPQPICGDGNIDDGEECDEGVNNSDSTPDACRLDCTLPACGDAVLDTGEECDDGNTDDGDGCSSICEMEFAIVTIVKNASENGTFNFTDHNSQQFLLNSGESKTFINMSAGGPIHTFIENVPTGWDLNSITCNKGQWMSNVTAGSFIVQPTYNENITCIFTNTRQTFCGDGTIQSPNSQGQYEQCESDGDCTTGYICNSCVCEEGLYCGNNQIDPGEECDGADDASCPGQCLGNCLCPAPPICGDSAGFPICNGACPQGQDCETDPSGRAQCICVTSEAVCGDGIVTPPEECDDGNNEDGDGCSAQCDYEACKLEIRKISHPVSVNLGDDLTYFIFIENIGNSTCTEVEVQEFYDTKIDFRGADPMPNVSNDLWDLGSLGPGENKTITVYTHVWESAECEQSIINEACVNANEVNESMCDQIFIPIECPFCGDGNLDEGEECDDGNNQDGDGCSANCTLEGVTTPVMSNMLYLVLTVALLGIGLYNKKY